MKGFTSGLRVFPSPLRGEQHRRRFLLEKSSHPSYHDLLEGENELRMMKEAAKVPASQIAYLFQRLMTASGTSNSVEDEEVRQLAAQCDEHAWDRLNELAEQGNADALGCVGASLLYGTWSSVNDVSDCVSVAPNASEAAGLLLRAFQGGNSNAARYLALALEIVSTGRQADDDPDLTRALLPFKAGLYHAAASAGSKAAFALLGNVYREEGDALVAVAAHHYFHAARDASVAYHERGKQPLHEMDRLYDYVDSEGREDLSARGQRGEDDELIQFQQVRADQHGDVEAMAAMGDLYYWGTRGPRWQRRCAVCGGQHAAERRRRRGAGQRNRDRVVRARSGSREPSARTQRTGLHPLPRVRGRGREQDARARAV